MVHQGCRQSQGNISLSGLRGENNCIKTKLFLFSLLQLSVPLLSSQHFLQDIVILLDTSGSMTGLRKEIAKHVVINIMDTLGEDDFVTVLTFSDETKPTGY